MSTAEEIASRIAPEDTDESGADADMGMKPGDHGKRILSAIFGNSIPKGADAEALEEAIKDCVADTEAY